MSAATTEIPTRYMVATEHQSEIHTLISKVNALMAEGWVCVGGIASIQNARLAQALTKQPSKTGASK